MERFRIGRYPFNFQGDLLRDVVVKLNYNFSLIEDLLRQGGVSIDPDNLITINNIEKLIQVINDKISNELNYLVYVYYDGIYHFLSDIEFSDDKVNLIFEGSIIKDGKIVSSTYIITCDLDSEGNILNVTSENSKREYNISGFRVIRIRTKPLEFIDEEDLKLVGEALKDPSNSNSVELSIQDNSSTTNLIPHQSILSTIVSDNEIAHELKFITGENLITVKFTYNSNTKELIGSPSLTESLAPSSETLILSEINDIPSGGRISDENYNRLVLAIENNADIYTTDNTGLIKSVILISDTDNEIILTVKDNNLTEKNIIISKLNNLIKTEKVELATKESVDNKVDKEPGKGLSSNDYTSEEKTLVGTIINKVDKVQGKGLSTYDLTEARKNKLDSYPELTGAGNKALMDNGTFVEITGEGIIFSDIEIINIEDLQVEYVTEEIYNKIANAIINNRHIVLNSINRSDVSPFSLRAAEPINVITYSVIRQEYLNFTNRDIFLVITDGTTTTEITIESTFHVIIIKRPSSISLDNSNPLPTVELIQTSIGLQANLVLAKSDSGVRLVKTEDGLVAQFKWDGEDQEIKLKYVTSQEYSSLNEIDQGTLYFITDNRYIMFQGIKYGDNISREEINDIKELLNRKVDKEEGKGLSSNDYSDSDKSKVDKIITSGEGNKYLSDNGEYLEVKGGSFVWDMTFAEQENPNVTGTGGIYTIYGALSQMYSNMSRYGDFAGVDYDKYPSFVLYPKFYTLDFWNKFIQAVKEGTPIFIRTCFLKNPAIGGYMPDADKENLNIRYSQILPLNVQMSMNGNYLEFNCRIPDGSLLNFANPSLSSYRVDKCFYLTFSSHKVENNEIIVENYPTIYPYPSNSSVMPYGGLYNPAWLKEYVTEIPLPNKEQFDIGDKKEDENKVPYREFSIKESLLDKVYIIPQFNDNSELLNYFDEIKEKAESKYAIYLNVNGTIYPCTVIPISDTIISLNIIAGNSINYAMISVGTYLLDKANNTVTLKDPTLMFNGDRDFVLDSLGNGTKFLSNDGTYKEIESSISPIIIDSEDNKVYTREEIHSILEAYSKGVPIFILDGENIIRATEVVGQRGQGEGMAYLSFYVPKILHEKKSGDTGLDTILISYKYELSEGSSIQVSSEYTNLIGTGNGNKYLSNDGTYKEIQVPSISPIVIDINDTEKVYTSEEITEIYQAHKSGRDIYLKFGSEPELRLVNAVASIGDSVILFASYITSTTPGSRSAILDLNIANYGVQITAGSSIFVQENFFALPKSGTGNRFLSDDGTYKKVVLTDYLPLSAGSENKLTGDLYFANGTKVSGSEENILSSDAQIEGSAFITPNNSGYIIKDSEGNNRTVLGLDSNNVLGVGVASGKTVLYSNSDLVHYTSGSEYKIWDGNNLIDPVTKSGNNAFTGTNSFVAGNFSVGPLEVLSEGSMVIHIPETSNFESGITWTNNNLGKIPVSIGCWGSEGDVDYFYLRFGRVPSRTAQYKFDIISWNVPSIWCLKDLNNTIINLEGESLATFGRSSGTTKIRSGAVDLIHRKGLTDYKIWDASNLSDPVTKSGDNVFTGNNSFTAGQFNVGSFIIGSDNDVTVNLSVSEGGGWDRGLSLKANSNQNSMIRFAGYGNDTNAKYAYIGLGDVAYYSAQYKFYPDKLYVPSSWELVDSGTDTSLILYNNADSQHLGRAIGVTYIRSGDSDLYHTKNSTNYKILDEFNWESVIPNTKWTYGFVHEDKTSYDLNIDLVGPDKGKLAYNYTGPSYWINGPTNMQYGTVLQIWGSGSGSSLSLMPQLAFDVNHNVAGSTRYMYFRTPNNLGYGDSSNWKRVITADEKPAGYVIGEGAYPGLWSIENSVELTWLRSPTAGFIPNSKVDLSSGGMSSLGTSEWAFQKVYTANIYANNYYFGGTGMHLEGNADEIGLLNTGTAKKLKVGSLLVSPNYSNTTLVPSGGIFSSGRIQSDTAMLVGYSNNITNGQLGYGLYYAGTMGGGMGSEYSSGALVLYRFINPNMGKAGYNVPYATTGTPTYLKIHAGALTLGVGETKAYTAGEDVTVTEYNVLTSKGGALSTGESLDFYAGSEGAGGGIGNCTKGGIWYWFPNDGGVVVGNSAATHVTLRTAADQKLYHQITTGAKYEIITERGGQIGPLTISGNGSTPFVINNHNPDGTDIIQIFRVQGYNRFLVGWSETSGGPFIQRSSDNSCILIKSDGAYWGSSLGASAIKKLATQEWVLEQLEALKTS